VFEDDPRRLEINEFKFQLFLNSWLNTEAFWIAVASIEPPSNENFTKQMNLVAVRLNLRNEIIAAPRANNEDLEHCFNGKWDLLAEV
jgi:hypothetical protein